MAPTEIDLILRSIDLLREETRISHRELRDDLTGRYTDHEKRIRDLEELSAQAEAVRGYKSNMARAYSEDRRWRIGLIVTGALAAVSFLLQIARSLGWL